MKKKDERGKVMNEVLQGIRVIKFFAWETSFSEKIKVIRGNELTVMQKSMRIRAFTGFLWAFVPTLVSLTSFTIFTLTGGVLTAEVAFSSLGAYYFYIFINK